MSPHRARELPAALALGLALVLCCHFANALPTDSAAVPKEDAAGEAVAQRDPEEQHPVAPPSGGGGLHIPYPSEIIHAVGSLVHGAAQQHHEDHHEQHHEQHHEHHSTHRPPLHRPHHHREKIRATKTVFVEYTKLVTRHPVCLAVHGVKPPCLPYIPHATKQKKPCHGLREESEVQEETGDESEVPAEEIVDEEDDLFNETELKEGIYISPTAVAELSPASVPTAAADDLEAAARSARYLELRPLAPIAAPVSATPELPALSASSDLESAQLGRQHGGGPISGLLGHNKPEVEYETKTLWVTRVEKVIDHRVTATLIAANCIPTDSKIPLCGGHGHGPTYGGGDEIVLKPPHRPIHKPVHKPIHKPVHKPVHRPVHKPVHHEPVHKPVHHEPVHKPVHHEPVHKPVHHEPVHKPVHHEPVHKPVHHEPVHKPVYKPIHEKPSYGVEYTQVHVPAEHWEEAEEAEEAASEEAAEEVPAQAEAESQAEAVAEVEAQAEAQAEEQAEEQPME